MAASSSHCVTCGASQAPQVPTAVPESRSGSFIPTAQHLVQVKAAAGRCLLTAGDYAVLQELAETAEHGDPLVSFLLRQKLAAARVILPQDMPASVATLNSRVVFRLEGRAAESRVLAFDTRHGAPGLTLGLYTPLGITLLGMSAGDQAQVCMRDTSFWPVILEQVTWQPEASLNHTLEGAAQ